MRRIVPIRYTLHAMRARGREYPHTAAHSTAARTHSRTAERACEATAARARASPRERARAKRAAAVAAGRTSRKTNAPCPQLQVVLLQTMLKKLSTLHGRGEAPALRARTLPRARRGHARAGAAPDHVLHDGENVSCAILSSCSINTGVLLMSGAAAKIHRRHDGAVEPRGAAAAPAWPEPREHARVRASRGAKHHIIIIMSEA